MPKGIHLPSAVGKERSVVRARLTARAYQRAYRRLAKTHPQTFAAMLKEEMQKAFEDHGPLPGDKL